LNVLRQRLDGIDKATELLNETVNRTPTQIQTEIRHLRELMQVEVEHLRELVQEKSSANRDAVDAALASQKEATSKAEALGNSNAAKLETLFQAGQSALGEKVADLQERVNGREQRSAGGALVWGVVIAAVGVIAAIIVIANVTTGN
jgi:hypothetical protein